MVLLGGVLWGQTPRGVVWNLMQDISSIAIEASMKFVADLDGVEMMAH
ncbi:hypothetical protein DFE_1764 [Desulfovibrio ferrophilus]|uniref:Uncharacterized protein n=1 Tax=Desulfovibrio ferrophilus TaxID=241368 RepID=A0A2Z6AZ72_9BACT|nr:hypothetical protein DFE_1764 [Desulfovibrio ferrophilus]